MPEIWKDVIDFEGRYSVSNKGRVKRIMGGKGAVAGKILRICIDYNGYPVVCLYKNNTGKALQIHRLVLKAFVGPCPPGLECCHNDGNKLNSKLENLRWDTRSSNQLDSVKHGTHIAFYGPQHWNSKLTKTDVIKIQRLLFEGHLTQKVIGQRFNVSRATISSINIGRTWKHV